MGTAPTPISFVGRGLSGFCALVVVFGLGLLPAPAVGQTLASPTPSPEFALLAEKLAADRLAETDELEAPEEQALEILDRAALASLNEAPVDLDALNVRLAAFVTREPPLGEEFRAFRLGGSPAAFALLADFGEGGPSAVRIYAGASGNLALTARVDRYAQKDFLDDYMELVPVPGQVPLFVTIAGRTDDLKTGLFTAWRLDGNQVKPVWTSDILEQSSYEVGENGLLLTYCADPNPDDPGACHETRRERFAWQDGAWKQPESATVAPTNGAR